MSYVLFFFFNDTAPTKLYTLSLHDALPISTGRRRSHRTAGICVHVPQYEHGVVRGRHVGDAGGGPILRSEEHTSELQSRENLVCRLLLEKKKKTTDTNTYHQHISSTAEAA